METIGSKRSYALTWCMLNNDDDDDDDDDDDNDVLLMWSCVAVMCIGGIDSE